MLADGRPCSVEQLAGRTGARCGELGTFLAGHPHLVARLRASAAELPPAPAPKLGAPTPNRAQRTNLHVEPGRNEIIPGLATVQAPVSTSTTTLKGVRRAWRHVPGPARGPWASS
jgi:hypothetical protein